MSPKMAAQSLASRNFFPAFEMNTASFLDQIEYGAGRPDPAFGAAGLAVGLHP
jgi:hypothetical protein